MAEMTKTHEHIYKDWRLEIFTEPSRPDCWNYTYGKLFRLGKAAPFVLQVKRNYHHFWHAFIEQDGRDYLLCGENYQGLTLVDLQSGEIRSYLPPEATEGAAWCVASFVSHDPVAKQLTLEGCIWGGPFDRNTFDVRAIDQLPWPLLSSESADDEDDGTE
jgi:hypothetical protein